MKKIQFTLSLLLILFFSLNIAIAQDDNVAILELSADFLTVSSEDVIFSQVSSSTSIVYIAHDSISIEETGNTITVTTEDASATYEFTKVANPTPGKSDTAVFVVTGPDNVTTQEYKVVVARSLYHCKIGFIESGSGAISNGWTTGGSCYTSSSVGHGGLFPGDCGTRIFKGTGSLISPIYSSVKTLSFNAKFSKTVDETLIVQKSLDEGATWIDVETYLPSDGRIPAYSTEDAADVLAFQSIDINEENVMIRFQCTGADAAPRTMIDDIACLANYVEEATYEVVVNVFDINHDALQGALVEVDGDQLTTDASGVVTFDAVLNGTNVPYTISKDGATISGTLNVSSAIEVERTLLTEDIDLFLALGQSNMAGRAEINSYVSDELEGVSLLNDDYVWIDAVNPMNLYSNVRKDDVSIQKVGPSYSFAQTLAKYVDNRIGMIVNARGGTNITEFAGEPYYPLIAERIAESKIYGSIKGIIWHQGESNSSKADEYMGHLSPFVDDLRAEIGDDVYFVAGQLGPWDKDGTTEPKYGDINDTIANIANYVSNADFAKNDNLTDLGDNTHLNTESQILLGQRYAQKVLETTYATEISIVELTIGETGYVTYGEEVITSENDYSYTALASESIDFTVCAGAGMQFVTLNINGVDLADIAGDSVYVYQQSMSVDAILEIDMTIENQDYNDYYSVEVTNIEADYKTVSNEDVLFSQIDNSIIFVAHDSIALEETGNTLSITTEDPDATVEITKVANPTPGNADTTIFVVTGADNISIQEYKVVVARSLYHCKIGFTAISGGVMNNSWTADGATYASDTKGNGGQYPGEGAQRIYNSSSKGIGNLTSPVYSSIKSLSFTAKFSKTNDESLIVQKSLDEGATWIDVETYLPSDGRIPSYSSEDAADTLAYQTVDINEEYVMLRFQYAGEVTTARTMIDDIACLSNYDPLATYKVVVGVYDINHDALEGALVEVGGSEQTTDASGVVTFDAVLNGTNVTYAVSKDDVTVSGTLNVSDDIEIERTLSNEDIDLFLALGQSNMAGRAVMNDYVSDEIENVSLLNDGSAWVNAANPMNLYSNIRKDIEDQQVGPSYSFAKTLSKYVENRIGMVVNARGGTNIKEFAVDPYYTLISDRIQVSKAYGAIKGIIWHQGESNSSASGAYMGYLAPFVDDLRSETGEETYFVAGQLGPWDKDGTTEPKYGAINDTIANIANYVTNSDFAKNDNLSDKGDNTHFNVESQVLLGQRYAQKMLKKIYDTEISIVELTLGEDGYVMYGDEMITSENDYSYTALTSESIDFNIYAGEGKKFISLTINGVDADNVAGDTVYAHNQVMSADAMLEISMTVEDLIPSGINNNQLSTLDFYPNPASGSITVKTELEVFEVNIFDLSGRKVLEVVNDRNINIQSLQAGTYVIMLESDNTTKTKKLVVY